MSLADEVALLEYKEEYQAEEEPVVEQNLSNETTDFRDFFLRPELIRALADAGFERPSEVQHEAVPHAITGVDVLCQAKSGKGKTAVFVISILHQINLEIVGDNTVCLVLANTRELAYQIKNEFERFGKYITGLRCNVFYGGQPIGPDKALLKDPAKVPHIVIGTTGRLLGLIKCKALKVDKVAHFIIDECDKCLQTLEIRRDVQEIFLACPVQKQVIMLSATLSPEMRQLCKKYMQSPVEVIVDDNKNLTLHGLLQYSVKLEEDMKTKKLVELLNTLDYNQVVIFVKSVARVKMLAQALTELKFPALEIHRGKNQKDRIDAYKRFKAFEARIMVATDLFGRGIDIERVNIVVNYDMPDNADSYLHRVGRAGRFGTKGLAICFLSSPEDEEVLQQVQERFKSSVSSLPEQIDTSLYINQ